MNAPVSIPPEVRARLKSLRLRTRMTPAGQGLGQHASRSRGAGLEFAQYRAYEPGDEPRSIDWKLYARSDRFFVRDATRDSPLSLWVLLDTSASMSQADQARPDWSKFDAGRALALALAELALQQGDAFGLVTLGGGIAGVPAGSGPRHRDRFRLALDRLVCGGSLPEEPALRSLWERIAPASLVVVLSDFFDETPVALAERLAAARREVLTIQLLAADERDFPFTGGHLFRDPEGSAERRVDAEAVREHFLEEFADARARLTRRLTTAGVRHVEYLLDTALDTPLQTLLGPRGRGG
jgi:uncharacterized protein (DUF58 family)